VRTTASGAFVDIVSNTANCRVGERIASDGAGLVPVQPDHDLIGRAVEPQVIGKIEFVVRRVTGVPSGQERRGAIKDIVERPAHGVAGVRVGPDPRLALKVGDNLPVAVRVAVQALLPVSSSPPNVLGNSPGSIGARAPLVAGQAIPGEGSRSEQGEAGEDPGWMSEQVTNRYAFMTHRLP
jgi:hypothetical protein